ncbi:MAG: hypothetical protein M3N47_09035, partial [Chloroflexota bacterium]|nr:hypothetical protein [Chloroflexota bacterium]
MASFETVADQYDAARPSYPDEVFEALVPLEGLKLLDVGAGTGIATRALIARHADVIAVDPRPGGTPSSRDTHAWTSGRRGRWRCPTRAFECRG